MAGVRATVAVGAGLAAGLAAMSYPLLLRDRCVSWGATRQEAESVLPGDDLMPDADMVTTRAVRIDAPPECVWPWIVQIGSSRAGAYSWDWLENLYGLDMHSADVILPQFQDVHAGDNFPLASGRGMTRTEIVDPERVLASRLAVPGIGLDLVTTCALLPDGRRTRLLSRNRFRIPASMPMLRGGYSVIIEIGGLARERKILLGIKERAERMARQIEEGTRTDTIDLRLAGARPRSSGLSCGSDGSD
jgi:hypothetical protein